MFVPEPSIVKQNVRHLDERKIIAYANRPVILLKASGNALEQIEKEVTLWDLQPHEYWDTSRLHIQS